MGKKDDAKKKAAADRAAKKAAEVTGQGEAEAGGTEASKEEEEEEGKAPGKRLSAKERRKLKEAEKRAQWEAENQTADALAGISVSMGGSKKRPKFDTEGRILVESLTMQAKTSLLFSALWCVHTARMRSE